MRSNVAAAAAAGTAVCAIFFFLVVCVVAKPFDGDAGHFPTDENVDTRTLHSEPEQNSTDEISSATSLGPAKKAQRQGFSFSFGDVKVNIGDGKTRDCVQVLSKSGNFTMRSCGNQTRTVRVRNSNQRGGTRLIIRPGGRKGAGGI